jgi:sterol 3beta-glucosyltransferase
VNLLILTLDTRGDVQPFVALPRGLANAGHEAVLADRARAITSPRALKAA